MCKVEGKFARHWNLENALGEEGYALEDRPGAEQLRIRAKREHLTRFQMLLPGNVNHDKARI
jgi:hypothetical protein